MTTIGTVRNQREAQGVLKPFLKGHQPFRKESSLCSAQVRLGPEASGLSHGVGRASAQRARAARETAVAACTGLKLPDEECSALGAAD